MGIEPMKREHAAAVAELHVECFPGDFLPSFGPRFLTAFYEAMFEADAAFGYIGLVDGEIVGFCITTADVANFFSSTVKKGFLKLSWLAGLKLLQRPGLAKNVIETLLYKSRATIEDVNAEIIILAVLPNHRRSGIGNEVVVACEKEMIRRGVRTYKYTAYIEKEAAHEYFKKKGHTLIRGFELYGKKWHLFRAWLPDDPAELQ